MSDTERDGPDDRLVRLLEAVAARAAVAGRLEPPGGEAVLRSIVDAAVALFGSEAASIALHDVERDRLVFRYAAGRAGAGAVGLEIASGEGIAGYVFTTGEPLVVGDVRSDARFDRTAAEQSGYVPRQILAVPLHDDDGAIGVLEIIDRRDGSSFGLHDIELAGVFASQATVAIRASRVERDVAELLRATLARLVGTGGTDGAEGSAAADPLVAAGVEAALAEAVRSLDADDGLWALADAVARARHAAPDQVALIVDVLDALARRAPRRPAGRPPGRR